MFKSKFVSLLTLILIADQASAYSLPSFASLANTASSWTGMDISSITDVDITDVTDISGLVDSQDSILASAIQYLAGATPDTASLTSVATQSSSVQSVSSSQQEPYSTATDIVTSTEVDNTEYDDCVKYKFLGVCFWIKTSMWPSAGAKSAGQNYREDLQIEISSRVPASSVGIFEEADNASSDMFSGSIIQNIGTAFGRLIDLSGGINGPELQEQENQTDKSTSEPYTFKEAMVIGNPTAPWALSIYRALPGYCSSSVGAYAPLYLSSIDLFSWRILATTDAVLMAIYSVDYRSWNEVGTTMGSVFPRLGYIESGDEFNVAVTMAYRALSIVSDLRSEYSGVLGLHIGTPTPAYALNSLSNKSDYKYRTVRDYITKSYA